MRLLPLLYSLLDFAAPRRTRTLRVDSCMQEELPIQPETRVYDGGRVISLMSYREKITEALIRSLKYDGSPRAAILLGRALSEYLREEIVETRSFSQKPILVCGVPLHALRKRERGFDQLALVLAQLDPDLKDGTLARLDNTLLVRAVNTPPQTKLPRRSRLRNLRGAFSVQSTAMKGGKVYVIDDVTTTGATLLETLRILREAGAEAEGIALARA